MKNADRGSCPDFESSETGKSSDSAEIMARALEHHREERFDEATQLYEQILKDNPNDAVVLNLLGTVGLQTGNFPAAVRNFEKAVENHPTEDNYRRNLGAAYNALGAQLLSKGKKQEAMHAFEKAVSANPAFMEAYNNLGCLQKRTGLVGEAVRSFQKALSIQPDSAKILNNLGNALDVLGRIEEAIETYQRAIKINTGYARAHFNLGVTLSSAGKTDEALESYRRCIEANPKFFEAYNNLGNIYKEREQFEDAAENYRRAVEARPDYTEAHCNLGMALHDLEKYEDAAQSFQKAIEIHPEYGEAHYCLGLSLHKQRKNQDALSAYQRAVEINPHHYKAWYSLGNIYVSMEAHEKAARAYEHVVHLHGRFGAVYYNLAHAYRNIGEKNKAVDYLKLELDHNPDDYSSRYMLAVLEGNAPAAAPVEFVRDIFDQYADTFDSHLVEVLEYRTPAVLRETLFNLGEENFFFENVLDLGCGTGLAGLEFRESAKRLEGVDISSAMIEKARGKKKYDKLTTGNFFEIFQDVNSRYDLVVAADVFIYMGDLKPVMSLMRTICAKGAYVVFSLEHHDGKTFVIHDNGCYAHPPCYVEKIAEEKGFTLKLRQRANLRKEKGKWVEGDIYIFRNTK
jgi:predicted TPR repeat methyltransferase